MEGPVSESPPQEASLRCFTSAALSLAFSLLDSARNAGTSEARINTLLSSKEWTDFSFHGSSDQRLRVAIIPEDAYTDGVENLLKMVGAKTLESAAFVLVSTLGDIPSTEA